MLIGEAEGHNWWCVVFPSLCLLSRQRDSLAAVYLSQQDYALIQEETPAYTFQFHVVEWWEGFKHWWATPGIEGLATTPPLWYSKHRSPTGKERSL